VQKYTTVWFIGYGRSVVTMKARFLETMMWFSRRKDNIVWFVVLIMEWFIVSAKKTLSRNYIKTKHFRRCSKTTISRNSMKSRIQCMMTSFRRTIG